jgi:hypothetical protein
LPWREVERDVGETKQLGHPAGLGWLHPSRHIGEIGHVGMHVMINESHRGMLYLLYMRWNCALT